MTNGNFPYGNNVYPFVNGNLDNDTDVKLYEDQYEVYVNEQFAGHKTLKNQGEDLSDIDDFLRNQGLHSFSSSLDGDHYLIQTNEQESDIINALSVYFYNR